LELSKLFEIFLTAALTIIGGVIIFVTGQLILRFIVEPIQDLNRLRGEIAYSLIFYSNVYMNVPPPYTDLSEDNKSRDEVQKIFRQLASQLCPKINIIPWSTAWGMLQIVPKFQNVTLATTELIGLSNSIHAVNVDFNRIRREKIETLLNIKIVKKNK